ncbi:hypothetical protein [Streptomyces sp. LN704]|uniref:hypothetical protein n=1 Tax=Streptomyces sp. LN704 TaxID=3112982 RepID=UPI0037224B1B
MQSEAVRTVVRGLGEHGQEGGLVQGVGEAQQFGEGGAVGVLQVVDAQEHRPVRAGGAQQGGEAGGCLVGCGGLAGAGPR